MNYKQIPPAGILSPYIRYFGLLENDDASCRETTFKIIADGCPGLIFQENPDSFLDKGKHKLPQLFLHGLTTKHSEKTTKGNYRNIGIYLQPNALRSIFGIDADALTNRYVALDEITPNTLSEQLQQEKSQERRIDILSGFILQLLKKNSGKESQSITAAIRKIKEGNNETTLAEIQSCLNLSERSLERNFNSNIGISPKLFLRINRFQAALNCIRKKSFSNLTELAYHHSYADQSHFISEFKEFAGINPKQYLLRTNEQAINFPEYI